MFVLSYTVLSEMLILTSKLYFLHIFINVMLVVTAASNYTFVNVMVVVTAASNYTFVNVMLVVTAAC